MNFLNLYISPHLVVPMYYVNKKSRESKNGVCIHRNMQLKLNAFSDKDPTKGVFNIMQT